MHEVLSQTAAEFSLGLWGAAAPPPVWPVDTKHSTVLSSFSPQLQFPPRPPWLDNSLRRYCLSLDFFFRLCSYLVRQDLPATAASGTGGNWFPVHLDL